MAVNLTEPAALPPVAGARLAATCAVKARRRDDLTVMEFAPGAQVAAVFTQNRFPAAPVIVCRKHLSAAAPQIRALAINAGIANAGTAGAGLRDAEKSCAELAKLLNCKPAQILPFSTGVIMERLPMPRYLAGLRRCAANLRADNWLPAARAIMTTDTVAKGAHCRAGGYAVTGIAKGSGMIHPNMATMLAFVATDAKIPAAMLRRWQRDICRDTFNAVSVDGDTSTNDSFVLIATGAAGAPGKTAAAALRRGIAKVCETLAEAIVRDGEGAGKLVTITVRGGKTFAVCRRVAETLARSPLVKTALAAGDANVGRLLMALGNAGGGFAPEAVNLQIGKVAVIKNGALAPAYKESRAAALLAKDEIFISVQIGGGAATAVLKTCDLTRGYIDINAAYRS